MQHLSSPAPRSRSGSARVAALVAFGAALIVAVLVTLLGGDDDGGASAAGRPPVDDVLARERVAVHYSKEEFSRAAEALAPLIDRPAPAVGDLVAAAQLELALGDIDGADEFLARARASSPDDPGLLYLSARIRYQSGDLEDALELYRAALAAAPDDLATRLELARVVYDLELDGAEEEAAAFYDGIIAEGIESATSWYVTAVYRRSRLAIEVGTDEEARQFGDLWAALQDSGYEALKSREIDQGTLARIVPPTPYGTFPAADPALPSYGAPETWLPELADALELQVRDLNGDRRPDLVARMADGVTLAVRAADGWALQRPIVGPVTAVRALDLNQARQGDSLDLVALRPDGTFVLVEQRDDGAGALPEWEPSPVALPALGAEGADLEVVDFDHDGDLDLFAVGAAGARIFRNDGAGARVDKEGALLPRGEWTDASAEAALPTDALTWCAIEDVDGDQDVDLLCGGPGATHLLSSLRRGRFEDVSAAALGGAVLAGEPVLADLDGDGRPDIVEPGARAKLWRQTSPNRFAASELGVTIPVEARATVADLDLDGAADLAWTGADGAGRALLAAGLDARTAADLPAVPGARGDVLVDELDAPDAYGTLALEIVRQTPEGLVVHSATGGLGNAVYLKFFGKKDNRQAVGAVLEARARELYRRIFLTGEPVLVGLGPNELLDVMRVTWPNGVVQQRLDVEEGVDIADPAGGDWVQPEGLVGSCPFLYAWNGETFTFISDVLGITPLGLPMAPGMLVPPDHDEYVLVKGEQLAADANGQYVLQFTEELREVTYLDGARLDVVDHPAAAEIFPDERFCFPPFPAGHLHTIERALAPTRARGSDGGDWTAALAAQDDVHAVHFTRLGDQYLGLAEPHWLELAFDPDAARGATKLRLLCTGWFYWSDASVNMAAARTPGVEFVPPIVEVPDGAGGWRPIGPPVGFPAGKTKSMVVDLTGHLDPADPRVRMGSTLELYWDRIALAVCDDDAERRITQLAPVGAELWSRGFSRPVRERADLPERFDWDDLEQRPRWNQHPGRYTRFGDCLELTTVVDDRFVIMGSGDALTLRFDARGLPPLPPGWRRDFLVYLDGWAKDRDPNTIEALAVEPLPFHGMSGYPYGPEESFPDTPEHRAWREAWNTRPAYEWIVPLAPTRMDAWLAGAPAE